MKKAEYIEAINAHKVKGLTIDDGNSVVELDLILKGIESAGKLAEAEELLADATEKLSAQEKATGGKVVTVKHDGNTYEVIGHCRGELGDILTKKDIAASPEQVARLVEIGSGILKEL